MTKKINLLGTRFGRLVVVSESESHVTPGGNKLTKWLCKCDCGNMTIVTTRSLRSGNTKSCGCFKKELLSKRRSKGHESRTRLYGIWKGMKYRCFNEKSHGYARYGGRGITICDDWTNENGFQNFKNWANDNGYCDGLTIERIDNDGNYCPENCTWATYEQQANNTCANNRITVHGKTHTISEWSKITGLSRKTIWRRKHVYHLPENIMFTHSIKEVMDARKKLQNNTERKSNESIGKLL